MSNLILPQKWTRQPQVPVEIDWSNPFGARVEYYFTPDFQGGRSRLSPSTPSGGVTRVSGKYGIGLKGNGSSGYVAGPPNISIAGQGALTRFAVLRVGSGGSTRAILSSGGSGGAMWRVANNTDLVWVKTSLNVEFTQAGILSAGEYCILISVNNPAANAFYTYKNGVLVATTAAISTSAGGVASVGQSGVGSSFGDHELYLVGSLTGALSASEVAALSANPWQIFKPQPRRIFVASAGGGVSLSLTGQPLTANLGALSASVTSSVTGNQTTLQQGTITANVSQTLTGQAISLVQGSVSSDVSTVITGQTVSLAQGSVTDASSGNVTKALSGQSLSVSQGALTASISLALNGQSIVLSGGSVSPAISSALAGQQSSVQQGTISANISAGLTGQAVVLSNGTVAQAGSDVTKALTGQQLSIALGVLLEKKTIARPSSDTTTGAWLPSAGSSLYATLDEVSPDDADYIYTNSVSTCKIALNAVADPLTSSGQIVSYRVWSPNSDGLTVRLMQGATEIASWTHTVLPTSPTTYQQALTAGQCDAITDYSALAIQLESV